MALDGTTFHLDYGNHVDIRKAPPLLGAALLTA